MRLRFKNFRASWNSKATIRRLPDCLGRFSASVSRASKPRYEWFSVLAGSAPEDTGAFQNDDPFAAAALKAELGKANEAHDSLEKALDDSGQEPDERAWFIAGRVAELYGLSDVARSDFARAREAPQSNAHFYVALALQPKATQ